jgi:protein-disulfide isomerase
MLATMAGGLSGIGVGSAQAQTTVGPELLEPSPLGDIVYGPAEASVTVVEYASMTCGHCANFHTRSFPELKTKYIDTGKVRWIFREFPLDNVAAAAAMLARCAATVGGAARDDAKTLAMIDVLFAAQRTWAVERPVEPLFQIARQAGFTREAFEACLRNQQLLDGVNAVRVRAGERFRVQSTPTFFINGRMHAGFMTADEMGKLIDPLIRS